MGTSTAPRIVHAERLNGGIVIEFENGVCAVYSSELLYAHLDQAQIVEESADDE
jgi:hypothetical protein